MDRLPRTQRLLLLLRYAAGLSERQAAEAIGGDSAAAEGLMRRADQTVRRQLSLLRFKLGLPNAPAAREIEPLLREMAQEAVVPIELDAEAAAIILRASQPAKANPILIAAVVCLFLAAGLWLASSLSGSGEDGAESAVTSSAAADEDETDEDGSVSAADTSSEPDEAGEDGSASEPDEGEAGEDGSVSTADTVSEPDEGDS